LTQVPKCHHDRSYIEGAVPPAYQWLGRHILLPARRWAYFLLEFRSHPSRTRSARIRWSRRVARPVARSC